MGGGAIIAFKFASDLKCHWRVTGSFGPLVVDLAFKGALAKWPHFVPTQLARSRSLCVFDVAIAAIHRRPVATNFLEPSDVAVELKAVLPFEGDARCRTTPAKVGGAYPPNRHATDVSVASTRNANQVGGGNSKSLCRQVRTGGVDETSQALLRRLTTLFITVVTIQVCTTKIAQGQAQHEALLMHGPLEAHCFRTPGTYKSPCCRLQLQAANCLHVISTQAVQGTAT